MNKMSYRPILVNEMLNMWKEKLTGGYQYRSNTLYGMSAYTKKSTIKDMYIKRSYSYGDHTACLNDIAYILGDEYLSHSDTIKLLSKKDIPYHHSLSVIIRDCFYKDVQYDLRKKRHTKDIIQKISKPLFKKTLHILTEDRYHHFQLYKKMMKGET